MKNSDSLQHLKNMQRADHIFHSMLIIKKGMETNLLTSSEKFQLEKMLIWLLNLINLNINSGVKMKIKDSMTL